MCSLALLGLMAVAGRAVAKPPDLPINPDSDAVPQLPPPPVVCIDFGQSVEPPVATVDEPARPEISLSAQRTLSRCILFGVHPLLSLLPLPESLCEEQDAPESVPVAPPALQPAPQPTPQTCPWKAAQVAPAPVPEEHCVPFDISMTWTIEGNLAKLVKAEELYQQACKLVNQGCYAEAMACMKQADGLCPACRYQEMSGMVVLNIINRMLGWNESGDAAAEEEDHEKTTPCPPQTKIDDDYPGCCMEPTTDDRCFMVLKPGGITRRLMMPMNVNFREVPVREVLADLSPVAGIKVVIDEETVEKIGANLDRKITVRCDGVTVKTILELALGNEGLGLVIKNDCIVVTAKEKALAAEMRDCEQTFHTPGLDRQVSGLMKACHLALSCGKHVYAAELARQANALDPARVAADPVVYKMHLLALNRDRGCCEGCEPARADCCKPKCVCGILGGAAVYVQRVPVPMKYFRVEMLPPTLPPVDPKLVIQLDNLIVESMVLGNVCRPAVAKAKPGLEVVEEQCEPRAAIVIGVAKPFSARTSDEGQVISFDDMLRVVPGEMWTELDRGTNRLRVLWRVRVGGTVYRLRYDGGDWSLGSMPCGGSENCEEK
jgi:hypothetical protein